MHLEAAHFFNRGSVMDIPMMLSGLIPHSRHTWQWRRHPWYYIHCPQWVSPSTVFLNWHIGKESPSWYLSRQPIIITHLCLLIVRSFPAAQAQVGGLWFQAQKGLSWPWDTREVQPLPHGSGVPWLLITPSVARSLGIEPSKAFHGWTAGPQARWFQTAAVFKEQIPSLFLVWTDNWYFRLEFKRHYKCQANFLKEMSVIVCIYMYIVV